MNAPASKPIPSVVFSLRLKPHVLETLKARADAEDKYPAEIVTQALDDYYRSRPLSKPTRAHKTKRAV